MITIRKGSRCHACTLHVDCGRPQEGATHSARIVRKGFAQEVPFGLGLEGYVGVFQVWAEKLGRQRKKRQLKRDEIFLVIDLG